MRDREKAFELSSMNKYGFSVEESNAAYNAALEMAEWKEQQMIDKAVEWLKSNCTYNDNGVEKCIVNLGFFIDAMKEE